MYNPLDSARLTVEEIKEALGEKNAYFFFLRNGRAHESPLDLVYHFLMHRQESHRPVARLVFEQGYAEMPTAEDVALFI